MKRVSGESEAEKESLLPKGGLVLGRVRVENYAGCQEPSAENAEWEEEYGVEG